MGLGSRIKNVLTEKGLTIKELSKLTGIPVNTLYSITRRDNVNITVDNLEKIINALDVPVDQILSEKTMQTGFLCEDTPDKDKNEKNLSHSINTIAAHFDGADFTEEELEEIRQFAEFIRLRRNK